MVRELERTGAFERPVLALLGTTGTGWVDELNVRSIEYLTDGNCATAAMQYSFLPSPVAFVTDRDLPERAGRALVNAVERALGARPEATRPKLYLGGESLGSFGMQAAFADSADMLVRVDGAVWVGTPGATTVWEEVTAVRHGGSPQIAPVVDNGRHIRFATTAADLTRDRYGRDLGPWSAPRWFTCYMPPIRSCGGSLRLLSRSRTGSASVPGRMSTRLCGGGPWSPSG